MFSDILISKHDFFLFSHVDHLVSVTGHSVLEILHSEDDVFLSLQTAGEHDSCPDAIKTRFDIQMEPLNQI